MPRFRTVARFVPQEAKIKHRYDKKLVNKSQEVATLVTTCILSVWSLFPGNQSETSGRRGIAGLSSVRQHYTSHVRRLYDSRHTSDFYLYNGYHNTCITSRYVLEFRAQTPTLHCVLCSLNFRKFDETEGHWFGRWDRGRLGANLTVVTTVSFSKTVCRYGTYTYILS